jgi:hypothetical protein
MYSAQGVLACLGITTTNAGDEWCQRSKKNNVVITEKIQGPI